jgi:hydroxymethylbilane synthase
MKTYKIGTRGSLLAVTQSTLIKNQLEKMTSDRFELVLIKTQGDEITTKPLWQLEGKDFFTKELDEALLKGEVDFVIHSYKDLGSERPEGIKLAAVTERRFAHDILLIPQKLIDQLPHWEGDFNVGTSSPRRIVNLSSELKNYIPYINQKNIAVKTQMLRGNVNTRIKKLKDGQYHAVTLALAGLERLAQGEKSRAELAELLDGLNYFILPQSVFPSAASQGALGIEIKKDRDDGGYLLSLLDQLNHQITIEEVSRERKAFKEYGGGCHLAVGIHVKKVADTFLHVHAGEVDGKSIKLKKLEDQKQWPSIKGRKLFIGLPKTDREGLVCDQYVAKIPQTKNLNLSHQHVFVTSRYTLPTLKASQASRPQGLWAAGVKTAELLAQDGFWINGSADSLGTADLKVFQQSNVLKMMHPQILDQWTVLSHQEATSDIGQVVGCYDRKNQEVSEDFVQKMKDVGACFWTSIHQYHAYLEKFPFLKDTHHYCGLGKTWQEFKAAGLHIIPLANMQEFYELK